jgi:single-strand DNA-binding protein
VEGTMRQDRWEQDGQSRMKVIVNANTVQLLGSNTGGGGQGYGASQGNQQGNSQGGQRDQQGQDTGRSQGPAVQAPDEFSDDIPF